MLNKSYCYLIPLLNEFCKIDGDYYVMVNNVYTRHYSGDVGNIIIITYWSTSDDGFESYIHELKANELCMDYIEGDEVISLVFKFPDKYLHEYECYMQGRFSEFSDEAKKVIQKYILDIHKYKDAFRIKRVLDKDQQLRKELEQKLAVVIDEDLELSSIPDAVLETFYE
jgi:hypothetical protein